VPRKGFSMERHPLQALLDPAAYGERTTSVRLMGSQVPFSLRCDRAVFADLARRREFPSIFFTQRVRKRVLWAVRRPERTSSSGYRTAG